MSRQISYIPPIVELLDNGNIRLSRGWRVRAGDWSFIARQGFVSDGNSVPWLFRGLVPKFGRNTVAGIAHDWLYYSGEMINSSGRAVQISQRQADMIRLELCRWCSVPWWQRLVSYIGLRIGGWYAWRKHRKRRAGAERRAVTGQRNQASQPDNEDGATGAGRIVKEPAAGPSPRTKSQEDL
ncbi:hypothetical protein STSP2_03158 [Anaerohalosphaera lusitana]|uniref:DUF1353 domain-containing protein n=1 Tax=Anaerohalosphaera lusitana TaxID=1936003 RepID=A0A1U9NQF6_9BACT|nr:DUF1353 domain-containing protein [Anaerohalosphaera lusitana]AQT69958.1 hypothetical protein STSP2_03158 [Anaerohalosphaera lusitana]